MSAKVQIYCRRPSMAEMSELFQLGVDIVGWDLRADDQAGLELSRRIVDVARAAGVQTCLLVLCEQLRAIETIANAVVPDYLAVAAELTYDGPTGTLAGRLDPRTALMMSVPVRPAGSRAQLDSVGIARRFQDFADALILDTCPDPETRQQCGQTGLTNDWETCAQIVQESAVPVMLAGGLSPFNVAAAIDAVRPWGVDACTALETSAMTKDPLLCRQFIAAAQTAFGAIVR